MSSIIEEPQSPQRRHKAHREGIEIGNTPSEEQIQLLFYNVENLFHPSDDPENEDDDAYTPDGENEWSFYRYEEKLSELFKTIAAIGKGQTPAVMGFAELEEKRVLQDLIRLTPLDEEKLCAIQFPSPDHRGMDVGLIHRKDRFKPLYVERLRVDLEEGGGSPTREMLYVKGSTPDSSILHVFLAHWPSRWGGRARSEWKRLKAAERLKRALDSIENANPHASILVMGDLNDTPSNSSIRDVLEAGERKEKGTPWTDLMADHPNAEGSYFHQGHWSFLDHFIVPTRMTVDGSKSSFKAELPKVHRFPWLLRERRGKGKEERVPHRTFGGPTYIGGISDHLPISVVLKEE